MEIVQTTGGQHTDKRGTIKFYNELDLSRVKRMYQISPAKDILRGWQGHRKETKWFFCTKGTITLFLIKVDNMENPSEKLIPEKFNLKEEDNIIIEVPGGFANGFSTYSESSEVCIFSSFTLEESQKDDFRFDHTLWKIN